jgi:hypothetical protein
MSVVAAPPPTMYLPPRPPEVRIAPQSQPDEAGHGPGVSPLRVCPPTDNHRNGEGCGGPDSGPTVRGFPRYRPARAS